MVAKIPAEDLICPDCKTQLTSETNGYSCLKCHKQYPLDDGIHILLPTTIERNKQAEMVLERYKYSKELFKNIIEDPVWGGKAVLPLIPIKRGKILEVGAGICNVSFAIKEALPDCTVYATDVSYNQLENGKKAGNSLGYSIDYFATCDVESLPFNDSYFDLVYGEAVIHHTNSPVKAFSEIKRVLKPNGLYVGLGEVMCSKIFYPFHHRVSDMAEREEEQGVFEHSYTYSEWRNLIKKAGFNYVSFTFDNKASKYRFPKIEWFYYKMINRLPERIVKTFLSSPLIIEARNRA